MSGMEWLKNLGREILWYVVLLAGFAVNWLYITRKYSATADPASLDGFRAGLIIMLLLAWIFTFLWWKIANIRIDGLSGLRRTLESHSFTASVIAVAIAFAAAVVLQIWHPYILHRDQQHQLSAGVSCIYMIPMLFSGMMYSLPPMQIARVIMPGNRVVTLILRIVAAVAFFAAAVRLFGDSFL